MNEDWRASKRVQQIKKSAIHEMTRLSKSIEDVAFLSWAKPTSNTPDHIKKAAVKAIEQELVGGYSATNGIPELREEVSKKLKRDNKIEAKASEIIITVGAIEGLAAALMSVVDPGEEVILPSPTYSTHIRQVLIASGKPVFVPTIEEQGFSLDVDRIRKAITNKTLADVALEYNIMIITDEAYEYFVYDGNTHFSIASIVEMKKNVISCFTFTKTYAMTGWRIGYLHADESLVPQIEKSHIPFAICAPVVSQYAALAALKGSQECVKKFRKHYLSTRNLMCERLDRLHTYFAYHKPQGSYLMFPKILTAEGSDSAKFCIDLLQDAKVSTTPGVAFGPTGEGHLRLSFCVPHDMVNKAFDRIERYLK